MAWQYVEIESGLTEYEQQHSPKARASGLFSCADRNNRKEHSIPETTKAVPLGQIVATPNALRTISHTDLQSALSRHRSGDWGDCCPDDKQANDEALIHGGRLLSVYHTADETKFWIITEADRSATTVLMPNDY